MHKSTYLLCYDIRIYYYVRLLMLALLTSPGRNTHPELKHLYEQITPHYAPDWKVFGELLGISKENIRIIESDHPRSVKQCCNEMLSEWLRTDGNPSWEKILVAIESPAIKYNDQTSTNKCE